MTRRTRRLRTRLVVAMVAIALGTLVVTAAITAGLARRTSTNAARDNLSEHTPIVANELNDLIELLPAARNVDDTVAGRRQIRRIRNLVQTTLAVSGGAVVGIDAQGNVREFLGGVLGLEDAAVELPNGVSIDDLDTKALLQGDAQKGRDGDTVFQAEPLTKVREVTPVVVLSEHVNTRPFGDSSGVVLGAAVLALGVAVVVAVYLARRMTRPLAAMEATAGRIAAGDLTARVDTEPVADDELASLANAINTMAERLDSSRGHERAFLLSVSHDLRTPLTSIRGYAEAMLDGTIDDQDARLRAAEVIAGESRRLERLVADLLDLARLDTHQFSLRPQPIDAREVVEEAVDAFRPAATELGLVLEFHGPPDAAPGYADPQRLAQIVANLVENAVEVRERPRRRRSGHRRHAHHRHGRRRRTRYRAHRSPPRLRAALHVAHRARTRSSARGSASRSSTSSPPRWAGKHASSRMPTKGRASSSRSPPGPHPRRHSPRPDRRRGHACRGCVEARHERSCSREATVGATREREGHPLRGFGHEGLEQPGELPHACDEVTERIREFRGVGGQRPRPRLVDASVRVVDRSSNHGHRGTEVVRAAGSRRSAHAPRDRRPRLARGHDRRPAGAPS